MPALDDAWASDVVLGDGASVHIRPIRPSDAPALAAFHLAQPAEANYRRYFSPKPELTEHELEHFTNVDMVDRVALVVEDRGELIGWASYERWPGRADADAAFQVDAHQQGRGIATLLLEHLAAIARTNGITKFTAEVLADNRPMLAVFTRAGWPVQRRFESGIVDLDWPLDDTSEFVDSVERREQRADSRAVARLLMPRTIAVVGASDEPGSVGADVWHNVSSDAVGPVYAVNPNHETVGGQPAYPTLTAVPEGVHLAVITVPAEAIPAVIEDCIEARVRGAVIITSIEGTDIDFGAIVTRARRYGLRLIGPGSMGIAASSPDIGLNAALVPVKLPPGPVAISMQSGSLGASLLRMAGELGMGLSWFVSLGDKADISANDLMQFWEDDETTKVIALYTETLGNPRKFARIARRISRERPIVTVRTGTAAIGPSSSALYHQVGLIEVPTVATLLDTTRVFASQPAPAGPNVAVISNAQSPATLATAALRSAGLHPRTAKPILTHTATASDFAAELTAALADDDIHAVMVIHAPPMANLAAAPAADIDRAAAGATKPVVAVMLGADDGPLLPGSAVPAFAFPEPAAAVLGRMWAHRQWLDREAGTEPEPASDLDQPRAAQILEEALAAGHERLGVATARDLLASYGIWMPLAETVAADEAVDAATRIGFPVAVKAEHRHVGRTVAAGVALDLEDADDVRTTVAAMRRSLGADADRVLVQAMAPPGLDARIRAITDDELGATIAIGLGGRDTDLVDDEESRLTPLSSAAAARLVERSRVGSALAARHLDDELLTDVLLRAAQLVADHPEIVHLDLNPVIVAEDAICVTDAQVRIAPWARGTSPLRRLR